MKKTIFFTFLLYSTSLTYGADLTFNYEQPNVNFLSHKKIWATYYHIWPAKETTKGFKLLSNTNTAISPPITAKDLCMGGIEGTIQIKMLDNTYKTYNYIDHKGIQQVDCSSLLGIKKSWIYSIGKTRYSLARGIYGDGVQNYKLIPYRTIAVDPVEIPYGTVLYIPQARDKLIELPNGKLIKHDGFFYAADTGGAIKGNHIDIFSGIMIKNPFPEFIKSNNSGIFEAYIIKNKKIEEELKSIHQQ